MKKNKEGETGKRGGQLCFEVGSAGEKLRGQRETMLTTLSLPAVGERGGRHVGEEPPGPPRSPACSA